jgi:hypothetical protein
MAEETNTGSELRETLEGTLDENRELKLELALTKAGVDVETPMGAIFAQAVRSRGGELNTEAISGEWAELNPGAAQAEPEAATPPPAATPDQEPSVPGVSAEAMESLDLANQAADTSVPPAQRQDLTAPEAAKLAKQEAMEAGMDSTTQQSAFFGTLLSRAAANDPTALWTQEGWNEHLREFGELPA